MVLGLITQNIFHDAVISLPYIYLYLYEDRVMKTLFLSKPKIRYTYIDTYTQIYTYTHTQVKINCMMGSFLF